MGKKEEFSNLLRILFMELTHTHTHTNKNSTHFSNVNMTQYDTIVFFNSCLIQPGCLCFLRGESTSCFWEITQY